MRTRPLKQAREWGYQRLAHEGTVLIVDAAPPPLARVTEGGCASTLAFEMSDGKHRIVVNCGGSAMAHPAVPKALVDQDVERLIEMARQDMAQRGMNVKDMPFPPELFTAQAERRVRLGFHGEQRFDRMPQFGVGSAEGFEERPAVFRAGLEDSGQHGLDLGPAGGHCVASPPSIWCISQSLAVPHSRLTVEAEIPITSAVSSTERPPK